MLQNNLETSRTEHDRLKTILTKVSQLTNETTLQLRNELDHLKKFYVLERINLETQCESLSNSFEILCNEHDNKERELVQRLTVDHELEISDYRKVCGDKDDEIRSLRDNYVRLENRYKKSLEEIEYLKNVEDKLNDEIKVQIDDFQRKCNDIKLERDRCIKETTEMLVRDHKIEIDNLRAKFRLMTSPTDTDKIDLEALKQKYELDKQMIISSEAEKWQETLNVQLERVKNEFKAEKDALIIEIGRRVSEEKDKQIELLRERETNLMLEVTKYKNTIQQLVESESESRSNELFEKVETLEREKCQLEAELSMERSRRLTVQTSQDMSASVAVYEGKVDAATSPKKHRDKLTRSQTSLVKCGKLSIDTCNKGDNVLVVWDKEHQKYMILQESDYLFFLNSDCLEILGLRDQNEDDRKMYCICEVVEKEYCHAKKVKEGGSHRQFVFSLPHTFLF